MANHVRRFWKPLVIALSVAAGYYLTSEREGLHGLDIDVNAPSHAEPGTARAYICKRPCDFKNEKGVGIGSTRAQVTAQYEKDLARGDEAPPPGSNDLVVGSIFGGVIFELADDKVTSLFVGAAAE